MKVIIHIPNSDHRIEMIKALRWLTRSGLRDAKDVIDQEVQRASGTHLTYFNGIPLEMTVETSRTEYEIEQYSITRITKKSGITISLMQKREEEKQVDRETLELKRFQKREEEKNWEQFKLDTNYDLVG